MPSWKRPPESRSRLATDLAVVIVSRSMIRQMPVPTFRRVVTAAAYMSDTNGSWVCLYSSGSSPLAGQLVDANRVLGREDEDADVHHGDSSDVSGYCINPCRASHAWTRPA